MLYRNKQIKEIKSINRSTTSIKLQILEEYILKVKASSVYDSSFSHVKEFVLTHKTR